MCTLIYLEFMGTFCFLNPIFTAELGVEHDCLDTCCFGCFIFMSCIFVFAPVQRNCACFTRKGALEIRFLLLLSASPVTYLSCLAYVTS